MADIKTNYGTHSQALTITLASLASSATAGRESTVVNNGTNLFMDALVSVVVTLAAGTSGSDRAVYVYAYGTSNDGTDYTGSATGTDAAYTQADPTPLKLIGVIPAPTQSLAYKGGPWSVAAAFGGVLPAKWGIIVRNFSGITLTATAGNHKVVYQGVFGQSV
jgi:hypothetical protein